MSTLNKTIKCEYNKEEIKCCYDKNATFDKNYIELWELFEKLSISRQNPHDITNIFNKIKNILSENVYLVNATIGRYYMYTNRCSKYEDSWESKCNILSRAVVSGYTKLVYLLLKLGANVNILDDKNMTPLHWAVYNDGDSQYNILKRLLEHSNIKIDAMDIDGFTPFNIAVSHGQLNLAYVLYKHGCDTNGHGCNTINSFEYNDETKSYTLCRQYTLLMRLIELHKDLSRNKFNKEMIETLCLIVLLNNSERSNIDAKFQYLHYDKAYGPCKGPRDITALSLANKYANNSVIKTFIERIINNTQIDENYLRMMKILVSKSDDCFNKFCLSYYDNNKLNWIQSV